MIENKSKISVFFRLQRSASYSAESDEDLNNLSSQNDMENEIIVADELPPAVSFESEESKSSEEESFSALLNAAFENDVFKMLLECQTFNIKYKKVLDKDPENNPLLRDIDNLCQYIGISSAV